MPSIILTTLIASTLSLLANHLAERFLISPLPIIGPLQLQLTHNPDIAFSLHLPGMFLPLLIAAALLLFLWFAWKSKKMWINCLGFGFILGGAIANIIDRLPDGLVTDYVRIGSFPVFNAADSFITIGVLLLLYGEIFQKRNN